MTTRIFWMLAAGLILAPQAAFAQSDLVHEAYPVADLVVPLAPLDRSAPVKITTSQDIATNEAELMARIFKNVAPKTWDRSGLGGNGRGTMRFDLKGGYLLHVEQTPTVHAELKKYLATLPRGQIALELRVVAISEKSSEELIGKLPWKKNDGIDFAQLDDVHLFRLIEGIQADPANAIMQMPKVTLFNGQDARLETVDWLSYQTGANIEMQGGSPTVVGQMEKFFTGVKVRYLPRMSSDQKQVSVQMDFQHRSLVADPAVIPVSLPVTGGVDDAGVPIVKDVIKATVQKPAFNEIKLAVAAKVPDRRTVAFLAGKMVIDERVERPVPPAVARIPYVNRLFRNISYAKSTQTVVVFLTPRIWGDPDTTEVERLGNRFRREEDEFFPLILPNTGK